MRRNESGGQVSVFWATEKRMKCECVPSNRRLVTSPALQEVMASVMFGQNTAKSK